MKATIELLKPEDVPRLWDLCQEQNERDGTDYGPPNCFLPERDKDGALNWTPNPNVPLALKLVSGGRILQGYTFERRLEFASYGTNPRATAAALRELPAAMLLLEQMGYEGFHAAVPHAHLDAWLGTLGERLRMQRDDDRLAHFYRRFREAK